MASTDLVSALRAARQSWLVLPGLAPAEVRVLRPAEAEFGKFVSGVTVEHVCAYVDGWRNVTEATLLGATVGADDPVDFRADLWSEWVRDRIECIEAVAQHLSHQISAHLNQKRAASGN